MVSELSFSSRFKIYVLMVSTLAFVFRIIRSILCSHENKFFKVKEFLPQSRNISIIKEIFQSQENFTQSRHFSTVKKFFAQKNFTWSRKFSRNKNDFYCKDNFTWSRKFSTTMNFFTKIFFILDQGSFTETKIFTQSRKISASKDQKV